MPIRSPSAFLHRVAGRARTGLRAAALRSGLLRYRTEPWSPEKWRWGYETDHLDYFAGIDEMPRYSLILGYLTFLGGEPDVLDVGCGQGLLRQRMESVPFARYVGVDPARAAIERARESSDLRTTFVVGDITDRAVDVGTFDVVICNEVISIVPDPEALLDRVGELLRPGGHLLVSTWRHPGDQQLFALVDQRFDLIDVVYAQNPANDVARRGWRVSCHLSRRPMS